MPKHESIDSAQLDEEVDKLIKDGYLRAECNSCGAILNSINDKVCTVCNNEIDQDEIIIKVIDWSKSN